MIGRKKDSTPEDAASVPAEGGRPRRGRGKDKVPQTVPSVNLLSPWVLDELRTHQLRNKFIAGGVALVLALGAFFALQSFRLMATNDDLAAAEEASVDLNRQISELTPVANYIADVEARAGLIVEKMRTEVAFGDVLRQVRTTAPAAVKFENVSVTIPGPAAELPGDPDDATRGLRTSCGGPDPFAVREVVGCISLAGTATDRAAIGALVDALDANDLFIEPFVTSTSTTPNSPVTFSGSVGLSPAVFSERYDTLVAQTTGEDVVAAETSEEDAQ